MITRGLFGVLITLLALLSIAAAGCGISTDIAATAFAATSLPPQGTPVENGSALQPGDQVGATIRRQGEEHLYTFYGESGQAVTVRMEAGPDGRLDSYLVLRGPDGAEVARNDNTGGANSVLFNVTLPQAGEYTIVAHGSGHRSTGSYSLTMNLGTPLPPTIVPTGTPTILPAGGAIALGERQVGSVPAPGLAETWTFSGRAGDVVTIDLRAGNTGYLDPYLELLAPGGRSLIVDDDSGDGTNARIWNFVLPEDGEYAIVARGFGSSSGAYELALSAGVYPTDTPPPPTPGPSPTPYQRSLALGESAQGLLAPQGGSDSYLVHIEAEISVQLLVEAEDPEADLYVDMLQPNDLVARNLIDYNSTSSTIYLPSIYLRTPGDYLFRVLNYDSFPTAYTITVAPSESRVSAGGAIAYNQGVTGELLYAGQRDYWTFTGRAGDVITIVMNGIEMDSLLTLVSPDGQELERDDDSFGGMDSRIDQFVLPADGVYSIVASSYRNTSYGPYRLSLFLVETSAP